MAQRRADRERAAGIELRSLAGVGWKPLAAAFNAAFSDCVVPMSITANGLAAMQRRRGYADDVSFGE
jgi:hypothetical protein